MKLTHDTERAKALFFAWPNKWFTPEEVKSWARLPVIGVPALARKLRLYRKQGILESRTRQGKTYKEYHAMPGYKPLEAPIKGKIVFRNYFFYTAVGVDGPSPLFVSIDSALRDCRIKGLIILNCYTGSYEAPIKVEL